MNQKSSGMSFLSKYQKYTSAGVAALVGLVIIAGVVVATRRGDIQNSASQASCLGYSCRPTVQISARVYNTYGYGGNFTNGTLKVTKGQRIELTWNALAVDSCQAQNGWTSFTGLYLPPTLIGNPITTGAKYTVVCNYGHGKQVQDTVNIAIKK